MAHDHIHRRWQQAQMIKEMNYRNLLFGIVFFLMFTSCQENEIVLSKLHLIKVTDPIANMDLLTYDNGKLVLFQRYFGQQEETVTTFHYAENLLSNATTVRSNGQEYIVELEYDNNAWRHKETITFKQDDVVINITTTIFKYDINGDLETKEITHTATSSGPTETEFEWKDGNIIKMNFYLLTGSIKSFAYSRNITYDDKINFTNQDLSFLYITPYEQESVLSKNNRLSTFDSVGQQAIDRGSFIYKYNEQGYPIEYVYKVDKQEFPTVIMEYN